MQTHELLTQEVGTPACVLDKTVELIVQEAGVRPNTGLLQLGMSEYEQENMQEKSRLYGHPPTTLFGSASY